MTRCPHVLCKFGERGRCLREPAPRAADQRAEARMGRLARRLARGQARRASLLDEAERRRMESPPALVRRAVFVPAGIPPAPLPPSGLSPAEREQLERHLAERELRRRVARIVAQHSLDNHDRADRAAVVAWLVAEQRAQTAEYAEILVGDGARPISQEGN